MTKNINSLYNILFGDRFYSLLSNVTLAIFNKIMYCSALDFAEFAGYFVFCYMFLYFLNFLLKKSNSFWLFLVYSISLSSFVVFCFWHFFNLYYFCYVLIFSICYYFIVLIVNYLNTHIKNNIFNYVFNFFQYWLFAVLLLFFVVFSLHYFVKESALLSANVIEIFIVILFLLMVVFLMIFRAAFFSENKIQNTPWFNNVLRIFYSACWFSVVLFWFFWFAENRIMFKVFNIVISIAMFFSLHVLALYLRDLFRSVIQKAIFFRSEAIRTYNLFIFVLNLAVNFIIALAVFYIWNYDLLKFCSVVLGYRTSFNILNVFFLFVAYRLSLILSDYFIKRLLKNASGDSFELFHRFETLKSSFKIFMKSLITLIACVVFASIVGINAAPTVINNFGLIFAALSFGLQTLAKDFVTGIIMMFEETFHVGDLVSIGSVSGRVEEITLRLIKIRSFEGSLIYIPFNKVDIVANKSRDFIFAILSVVVNMNSDIEKVIEVMKQATKELALNVNLKEFFIDGEHLDVFGPTTIQNSQIIIDARLKMKPVAPKRVTGAYLAICHRLFEENDIKFSETIFVLEEK